MINYCVYILYSKRLDKYYIGETMDLSNRVVEHNTGFYRNSYTAKTNDWTVFLQIECLNRSQARKIENHIKKMKSLKYIQDLKRYPNIILKLKENY
ncbi:MAG: GIY-YIG nuclease family protein [Muriicola sp.]|nr:GIY-YIG nuclease family protein [Muriicola sp.]